EIQIRTVASHAWAEFEHSRRYKGVGYRKVSEHDRETIDQLFGAAADARSALDETFTAIDRVLANPSLQPHSRSRWTRCRPGKTDLRNQSFPARQSPRVSSMRH